MDPIKLETGGSFEPAKSMRLVFRGGLSLPQQPDGEACRVIAMKVRDGWCRELRDSLRTWHGNRLLSWFSISELEGLGWPKGVRPVDGKTILRFHDNADSLELLVVSCKIVDDEYEVILVLQPAVLQTAEAHKGDEVERIPPPAGGLDDAAGR